MYVSVYKEEIHKTPSKVKNKTMLLYHQSLYKVLKFSKFISVKSHFMHNCMGREIYERYHASYRGKEDVHTKLMRRYKDIPSWWFYLLLGVTLAVSFVLCIFLNDQIQMPWWGLLFAGAMAFVFTLPISIITATTNQVTGLILFPAFFPILSL